MVLVPEIPLNVDRVVERVIETYELQKTSSSSAPRGSSTSTAGAGRRRYIRPTRPATRCCPERPRPCGRFSIERLGDSYFTSKRRNESARAAIFTRKVGHTQRGGRPILFDSFYGTQLGGHALDLLLEGQVNGVAILEYDREKGLTSAASTATTSAIGGASFTPARRTCRSMIPSV